MTGLLTAAAAPRAGSGTEAAVRAGAAGRAGFAAALDHATAQGAPRSSAPSAPSSAPSSPSAPSSAHRDARPATATHPATRSTHRQAHADRTDDATAVTASPADGTSAVGTASPAGTPSSEPTRPADRSDASAAGTPVAAATTARSPLRGDAESAAGTPAVADASHASLSDLAGPAAGARRDSAATAPAGDAATSGAVGGTPIPGKDALPERASRLALRSDGKPQGAEQTGADLAAASPATHLAAAHLATTRAGSGLGRRAADGAETAAEVLRTSTSDAPAFGLASPGATTATHGVATLAPVAGSGFTARVEHVQQLRESAVVTAAGTTPELSTLELALHPSELGAVRVTVALQARALDITVACADPTTRAAVTAALPALHRELAAATAATSGDGDGARDSTGHAPDRHGPGHDLDDRPQRRPHPDHSFDDGIRP